MYDPIDPLEKDIGGKTYTLSKFPAIAGREIVALYPVSAIPRVGEYKVNEETMLKLMSHVYVRVGEQLLPLSNRTLVDNHVKDWEVLAQIELAMMEYNVSFFRDGRISTFLKDIVQKLPQLISKILTDLPAQSSAKESNPPRIKNDLFVRGCISDVRGYSGDTF